MIEQKESLAIGIQMETDAEDGKPVAAIWFDWVKTAGENDAYLTYNELSNFITQAASVRRQMEWAMSTFAYVKQGNFGKSHLVHKANKVEGTALCGKAFPKRWEGDTWEASPVISNVISDTHTWLCKSCYAAWRKVQG